MANVNRKWRKFVAIGCTHGALIHKRAEKAALAFIDDYKPETRVHGGDWTDQTAWRSGAAGTPDETANIELDLRAGIRFVESMRATHLLNGNHDRRIYKNLASPNAIVAHAAGCILNEMRSMVNRLGCGWIETYDIRKSHFLLGNTRVCHGWMYGLAATRQHADALGNVIFFHTHRLNQEHGRRLDRPLGTNGGYLADEDKLEYSHGRVATLAHQHGLVFGEYSDTECKTWIAKIENGKVSLPPR